MSSCWSCLVILEKGATVCPLCGADQTRPVKLVDPNLPQPLTRASFFRAWGTVIAVIVIAAGLEAGIYWYNFGGRSVSLASQAAEVAAKSLRELRESLSAYAVSTKDAYPTALIALSDRTSAPLMAARTAGYRLEYSPKLSSSESVPRGFVILARPEKSNYPSLFIDESGVVRVTEEPRSATVQDPPF